MTERPDKKLRKARKPVLWVIEWRERSWRRWEVDRVVLSGKQAAQDEGRRANTTWPDHEFRAVAYIRRCR